MAEHEPFPEFLCDAYWPAHNRTEGDLEAKGVDPDEVVAQAFFAGLRAVEAAVRADQEQTITQLHRAWAEDAEQLAAAQAVIAVARVTLEGEQVQRLSRGARQALEVLSQSRIDALQAHDRQVAAKAVCARSADYLKVAAEAVREQFHDDPDVLSRRLRDIAIRLRDMVYADRAAATKLPTRSAHN